jgi:hypothetical protein
VSLTRNTRWDQRARVFNIPGHLIKSTSDTITIYDITPHAAIDTVQSIPFHLRRTTHRLHGLSVSMLYHQNTSTLTKGLATAPSNTSSSSGEMPR